MIARLQHIRRLTYAETVKIENGTESFSVVVSWPAGQYLRRFTAADTETEACRHKQDIIRAVLARRRPKPARG